MTRYKRTKKEDKLVKLIEEYGEVLLKVRGIEGLCRWRVFSYSRLHAAATCQYIYGYYFISEIRDNYSSFRWDPSCFLKPGNAHFQKNLRPGLRQAVRSMLCYDNKFRKIEAVYVGKNFRKKLKVSL